MASIYELTGDWLRLYQMADEDDINETAFFDTMEGIEGEMQDKAESCARVITQLKSDIAGLASEIDRLTKRKKSIECRVKGMKLAIQRMMEVTGKNRLETEHFKLAIHKNPPSLCYDVTNIDLIPEEYHIKVPDMIDADAIKAELKSGKHFEFAHLEQGKSLRIS